MDEYSFNSADDELEGEAPETPEDVAVLYTWANVHGGKYRDFSASRREFRAQQRHRMVEQQREAELEAARTREEAASLEMEELRRLEEQARHDEALRAEAEDARRRAEENVEQERLAAQHHVEVAEELKHALDEAQREMEAARCRAEEQAARYGEADAQYRASARGQLLPGEIDDPYYYAGPLEATAFAPGKGVRSSVPQRVSSEKRIAETYYRSKGNSDAVPVRADARPDEESYGFFASGQRPRNSSAGRPVYTETGPGVRRVALPFAEAKIETSEDERERHQADEQERLADQRSGQGYRGDVKDDGYYDGLPVHTRRSSDPSARNSAPSNVYLPPRVQQAPPPPPRPRDEPSRTREDVRQSRQHSQNHPEQESSDRVSENAADPIPGSPHMLDQSRARRRESAADVAARTTRRPRESSVLSAADLRDEIRTVRSGTREHPSTWQAGAQRSDHALDLSHPPADARVASTQAVTYAADTSGHRPRTEPARGHVTEVEARPEWLVREASSNQRDAEHRRSWDRSSMRDNVQQVPDGRRQDERRERRRSDAHMIPAADGGFNLPPLPDRSPSPTVRLHSAPERTLPLAAQTESTQEASTYRRDNVSAPTVSASEGVRSPREKQTLETVDSGNPLRPRSAADRRRSDRNSGDRQPREPRMSQDAPVRSAPGQQDLRESRVTAEPDSRPSGPHRADTLQQSRERVAARWFALKGLMGNGDSAPDVAVTARARETAVPILAVVSLSGGVGKTSLVATVGRTLSAVGERVLLADATPHSLLPYYFGARELRPDVVRTFSPPPGSRDAPVFMVNYEADRLAHDDAGQAALVEEIGRHVKGTGRMLLDLNVASAWLARRLAGMNSTILVPVAADMNSVLGIKSVERFFAGLQDEGGSPQRPYYVLNQFDASLPLHLDVREVLRQQLGDRLLPVMIRRSPSVAEALAEGMTVMDYAPESPVTEDYAQLAEWVRKRSAPAHAALRSTRWSER